MKKYILPVFCCVVFVSFVNAQKPEPTEKAALLTVIVENSNHTFREGEKIYFEGVKSRKIYSGVTADSGRFYLLLPKGDSYKIQYKNFEDSVDYSKIDIPNEPGRILYTYTLTIEPAKTYTLRDVHFETGKATLKPESFTALNDLVEVMKNKKKMVIEIAGHTDDVGDDAANLKLSQARAESVKAYLAGKGIAKERVSAKGYGETQPAADNSSEKGRQENRRTEVRIIKE